MPEEKKNKKCPQCGTEIEKYDRHSCPRKITEPVRHPEAPFNACEGCSCTGGCAILALYHPNSKK